MVSPSLVSEPRVGSNPSPVTPYRVSLTKNARTVISLRVRVPVLSVHITVVEPRVSTTFIRRTMAFFRDMLRIPSASVITRMMGNPSGTIATKMATAIRNCSATTCFNSSIVADSANAMVTCIKSSEAAAITAMIPRNFPRDSNLISKGVFGLSTSLIPAAMSPSCVFIPMRTITPRPRPLATTVPMNAMFNWSGINESDATLSTCLRVTSDSPVNEASLIVS